MGFDPQGQSITGNALPYSISFGNSQLAQGNLDLDASGNHAEKVALNSAGALYMVAANTAVLFVELAPCNGCRNWLNSVNNPFHAELTHALNPWWR